MTLHQQHQYLGDTWLRSALWTFVRWLVQKRVLQRWDVFLTRHFHPVLLATAHRPYPARNSLNRVPELHWWQDNQDPWTPCLWWPDHRNCTQFLLYLHRRMHQQVLRIPTHFTIFYECVSNWHVMRNEPLCERLCVFNELIKCLVSTLEFCIPTTTRYNYIGGSHVPMYGSKWNMFETPSNQFFQR